VFTLIAYIINFITQYTFWVYTKYVFIIISYLVDLITKRKIRSSIRMRSALSALVSLNLEWPKKIGRCDVCWIDVYSSSAENSSRNNSPGYFTDINWSFSNRPSSCFHVLNFLGELKIYTVIDWQIDWMVEGFNFNWALKSYIIGYILVLRTVRESICLPKLSQK